MQLRWGSPSCNHTILRAVDGRMVDRNSLQLQVQDGAVEYLAASTIVTNTSVVPVKHIIFGNAILCNINIFSRFYCILHSTVTPVFIVDVSYVGHMKYSKCIPQKTRNTRRIPKFA